MKSASTAVDLESVTMADYTVEIKPAKDESWEDFRVGGKLTREIQKLALQKCVKETLESAIPGSAIAQIGTCSNITSIVFTPKKLSGFINWSPLGLQ